MSYYATGGGTIQLVPDFNELLIEELLKDAPFDWDWENDDGSLSITHQEKYYDDEYKEILGKLAPFVSYGKIEFIGEDGSIWRLRYDGDKFVEENGTPVYEPEKERYDRIEKAAFALIQRESEVLCLDTLYELTKNIGLTDEDLEFMGLGYMIPEKEEE